MAFISLYVVGFFFAFFEFVIEGKEKGPLHVVHYPSSLSLCLSLCLCLFLSLFSSLYSPPPPFSLFLVLFSDSVYLSIHFVKIYLLFWCTIVILYIKNIKFIYPSVYLHNISLRVFLNVRELTFI